jgi:hypothetical protein
MSDPTLPVTVPLIAYHGDTWSQTFRLKQDTTPVDLTGATVVSWAAGPGGVVTLTAFVTNPTGGELQLSAVAGLLHTGSYVYDVEVTQGGAVTTWVRGTLVVAADVTNQVGP